MIPDLVNRKLAVSPQYTVLATIDDVGLATIARPILRPFRLVGVQRAPGLTLPQMVFHASWAGGNVTITGLDAAGVVQSEVLVAAAGTTVTAVRRYSVVTAVTRASDGAGSHVSTLRCSEGHMVQLPVTVGLRVLTAGTLVQTLEAGDVITETYAIGDICWGDVAIVGPASSATANAYGCYGAGGR